MGTTRLWRVPSSLAIARGSWRECAALSPKQSQMESNIWRLIQGGDLNAHIRRFENSWHTWKDRRNKPQSARLRYPRPPSQHVSQIVWQQEHWSLARISMSLP